MESINKRIIPTYEECVEALAQHGARLTRGVRNMANDTFAQKVKANRQKMKEIETELTRLQYDGHEVKMAAGGHRTLTDKERHGVITGIGQIYLLSRLLKNVMDDTLGQQLKENAPEAELVYDFSIRHIDLVADLLLAFTDRFSHNAKKSGKEDFGIELDLNSLCTDIDVLNIANAVNAFGTRFAKNIKMQEAEAKRFYEAKLNDLKAQQMALADEIDKMEQAV